MTSTHLRRLLLAVQVLHDIDLVLDEHAVVLATGAGPVRVPFATCLAVVQGAALDGARARDRLARWLRLRRCAAEAGADTLAAALRPVGLPVGHALHPGPGWALTRILGGSLELGPGAAGLDPQRPDDVCVVPATLWRSAGVDPAPLWPAALDLLERMGALAARRWQLDPGQALRPMGDCDVVTLLGSASLRAALAGGDGGGMRPAIVPMRRRGWTRLSRFDPAFGPAAAMATAAEERGFLRPVLVTAGEVVEVGQGGRAAQICLADPAPRSSVPRRTAV